MRRRRFRFQPPPAPRIELTSMIDVTFLILVFFMCTIRFRSLEGLLQSHLPRTAGSGPTTEERPERARVAVEVLEPGTRLQPERDEPWSGSGPWRYGPDRHVRYTIGPRYTSSLAEVRSHLSALLRFDADLEVVVDARPGTTYADVIGVVDVARECGCEAITFAQAR